MRCKRKRDVTQRSVQCSFDQNLPRVNNSMFIFYVTDFSIFHLLIYLAESSSIVTALEVVASEDRITLVHPFSGPYHCLMTSISKVVVFVVLSVGKYITC